MKSIFIILSAIILLSCNHTKRRYDIVRLQLVRSGAWSDYGAAITIDSGLNYVYYSRNLKQGYFAGKISPAMWDSLNQKFAENKFRQLQTDSFAKKVLDGQYFELTIYWKDGKTYTVQPRVAYSSTNPIYQTFLWLNDSYTAIKLRRLSKPVKFEKAFDVLPPLSSDSADFVPPLLDR